MPGIHIDITGDNSNIVSVIQDTTSKISEMNEYVKQMSRDGFDMSTAESSFESLRLKIIGQKEALEVLVETFNELEQKQKDAAQVGDTEEVERLGGLMRQLADDTQELELDTQKAFKAFQQMGGSIEDIDPDKIEDLEMPTIKLSSLVKSFLPTIAKLGSIAGIATVIKNVAQTAIGLTQRVGDTWGRETAGWKSSYEAFVRSIGSGKGFTQMIADMGKAYTAGRKVFDLMDELFEMQNSLTIKESNINGEIEENRQIMMDTTKSYKEREEAAQKIIDLEQKLGEERQKIADQALEAATIDLEKETNLTSDEREFFIEKYNDNQELIHQAMDYAEVIREQRENEIAYNNTLGKQGWEITDIRDALIQKAEEYNRIIAETPDEIKKAYEILMKYNEGSDKVIQTWVQATAKANQVSADTTRSVRRAETTKNRMQQESARAGQAYKEVQRKQRIQNEKEARKNALELRQAEIDAMADGTDKVLAQIDHDYEREKDSIKDWYDNLREEKIRKAKELWSANPDNRGKAFSVNENDTRWNATAAEEQLYMQKLTAAEANYNKTRANAVRDTDDAQNEYLKSFGSFWEQRQAIQKEYQDKIEASTDEWEKRRLAKERDNELKELSRNRDYLSESQRYEDKKFLIESESQDRLADLREREAELNQKLLETGLTEENRASINEEIAKNKRQQEIIVENTDNALKDLEEQYGDFYKRLAKDRTEWLIGDTVKLLVDAEEKLKSFGDESTADDVTLERIQRLKDEIKALKAELSEAFTPAGILKALLQPQKEGDAGSSLKERLKSLRDAWEKMTAEKKWETIGSWTDKIASGLSSAASYMKELAEMSGDMRLSDTADKLDSVARNFSSAGQGAASGGWIGAIVGGASDILSQTYEAITNIGLQEAIAEKNARDWANAIEMLGLSINEADFQTVFGAKVIGEGQAQMSKALASLNLYEKKLKDLEGIYNNQEIQQQRRGGAGFFLFGGGSGLASVLTKRETNEWKAYQDAIKKGYSGLQTMLVKTKSQTGWAKLFGIQDQFTSLKDLAPELWGDDGVFSTEAAKRFLAVNTQITDEQRAQIQNLIDLKDGYDEAMKAVDGIISDTFGNLASDLTDIIWDGVMSGSDVWDEFKDKGSEVITALGKQLVSEMIISEYLEQFRDQMREAYKADNIQETQNQLRNIVSNIWDGMENVVQIGSAVAEDYKNWASGNGFDLTGSASERTGLSQGLATASQDSIDALSGMMTVVQGHTFEIKESLTGFSAQYETLIANTAAMLEHTQGIHVDTTEIKEIQAQIAELSRSINSNVSTIVDRGVTMRG